MMRKVIIALVLTLVGCAHTGPPVYTEEEKKEIEALSKEAEQHQRYLRNHPEADVQNFAYTDQWLKRQEVRLKEITVRICRANGFEIPKTEVQPGIYREPFGKEIRIINAATDGSLIFTTAAMMKLLEKDDSELAAVIGHELGHIHRGHIQQRLLRVLPVAVLTEVIDYHYPGSRDISQPVAQIFLAEFDRDEEREADVYGILYMKKAGYDYHHAPNVWRKMAINQPEGIKKGLYFGHSHPYHPERLIRLKKVAKDIDRGEDPIKKYLPKEN